MEINGDRPLPSLVGCIYDRFLVAVCPGFFLHFAVFSVPREAVTNAVPVPIVIVDVLAYVFVQFLVVNPSLDVVRQREF